MKTSRRSFFYVLISTILAGCLDARKSLIITKASKTNTKSNQNNSKAIAGIAVAGKAISGSRN